MNGRLFWRTVDAAAARVEKSYSRPSQFPLNRNTKDAEGNTASDQVLARGIEEVEVGIGSDAE